MKQGNRKLNIDNNIENALHETVLSTPVGGMRLKDSIKALIQNNEYLIGRYSSIVTENVELRSEVDGMRRQINLLFSMMKGQNRSNR